MRGTSGERDGNIITSEAKPLEVFESLPTSLNLLSDSKVWCCSFEKLLSQVEKLLKMKVGHMACSAAQQCNSQYTHSHCLAWYFELICKVKLFSYLVGD